MADTWPVGDTLERSTGGLWGAAKALGSGIANAVGAGAGAGFGMGDASAGMAGAVDVPLADKLYQGATDLTLGQYPGYGDLWTYDTDDGVGVTREGAILLGAAAVAIWLVMFSGGR